MTRHSFIRWSALLAMLLLPSAAMAQASVPELPQFPRGQAQRPRIVIKIPRPAAQPPAPKPAPLPKVTPAPKPAPAPKAPKTTPAPKPTSPPPFILPGPSSTLPQITLPQIVLPPPATPVPSAKPKIIIRIPRPAGS